VGLAPPLIQLDNVSAYRTVYQGQADLPIDRSLKNRADAPVGGYLSNARRGFTVLYVLFTSSVQMRTEILRRPIMACRMIVFEISRSTCAACWLVLNRLLVLDRSLSGLCTEQVNKRVFMAFILLRALPPPGVYPRIQKGNSGTLNHLAMF
jgi:hypothetical protein